MQWKLCSCIFTVCSYDYANSVLSVCVEAVCSDDWWIFNSVMNRVLWCNVPYCDMDNNERPHDHVLLFYMILVHARIFDTFYEWKSSMGEVLSVNHWFSQDFLLGCLCLAIPKPHHHLPHLKPDWFYLSGTGLTRLSWKRGRWMGVVVLLDCPALIRWWC